MRGAGGGFPVHQGQIGPVLAGVLVGGAHIDIIHIHLHRLLQGGSALTIRYIHSQGSAKAAARPQLPGQLARHCVILRSGQSGKRSEQHKAYQQGKESFHG